MSPEGKFKFSELRTSLIIMGIFWVVAIVLWQTTGKIFYILNFGYIGTAIGVGGGIYAVLCIGLLTKQIILTSVPIITKTSITR